MLSISSLVSEVSFRGAGVSGPQEFRFFFVIRLTLILNVSQMKMSHTVMILYNSVN